MFILLSFGMVYFYVCVNGLVIAQSQLRVLSGHMVKIGINVCKTGDQLLNF